MDLYVLSAIFAQRWENRTHAIKAKVLLLGNDQYLHLCNPVHIDTLRNFIYPFKLGECR